VHKTDGRTHARTGVTLNALPPFFEWRGHKNKFHNFTFLQVFGAHQFGRMKEALCACVCRQDCSVLVASDVVWFPLPAGEYVNPICQPNTGGQAGGAWHTAGRLGRALLTFIFALNIIIFYVIFMVHRLDDTCHQYISLVNVESHFL